MATPVQTDVSAIARDVLARAALVHQFDPLELMPALKPEIEARVLALVAQQATEVEVPDADVPSETRTYWRLNPAARRSQLAALVSENRLDAALKSVRPLRGDTFAGHLGAALKGNLKPDSVRPSERDGAAVAADFAAEALGPDNGSAVRDAAARLRALLSQQVDQLRSRAIISGKLIGRSAEQAAIDAYIETGNVPESDRLPEPAQPGIVTRPYLLTGTPGAGKSALVSDLVRRRRGYEITSDGRFEWLPQIVSTVGSFLSNAARAGAAMTGLIGETTPPPLAPVVLLDFDRSAITLGGSFEWTAEVTRQLGIGRPDLAGKFSEMRARVRQHQSEVDPSGKSAGASATAVSELKTGLASVMAETGVIGETLVLVLDTFEEILVRSTLKPDEQIPASLFGDVLSWADSLVELEAQQRRIFGAVRVLVSGREKPDLAPEQLGRWFCGHRVVGNLADEPAKEFLRSRDKTGHFKGKNADEAIKRIGGHPLTLILLARYAEKFEPKQIKAMIADLDIRKVMSTEAATQALYSRFLLRFHHDLSAQDGITPAMVQAVAYPGLVLREITPELLRDVIAPVCDLGDLDSIKAEALLKRLRTQVWLVEEVPGRNAIRHRKDVRRLMLPMMTGNPDGLPNDEPSSKQNRDRILQMHRTAADWFDQTAANDPAALIEALYHRAFLPDRSLQIRLAEFPDERAMDLVRRVAESAGEDTSVMPIANRAWLRFYTVGPLRLTAEETAALPASLGRQATIEVLETSRRQVSPNIAAQVQHEAAARPPSASSDGLETAPANDATVREGTRKPHELFDAMLDRELIARIGYSFGQGAFEDAAALGWTALTEFSAFPDLSESMRFQEDPVSHWIWQSALARLLTANYPPRPWLEDCLVRLAKSVDPRRARIDSAGLTFAAATTIALGGRLSPETTESTRQLSEIIERTSRIESHGHLRILALSALWREREPLPRFEVAIPFSRIRLFAHDLLGPQQGMRPELGKVWDFVDRSSNSGIVGREIDRFVAAPDFAIHFTPRMLFDSAWRNGIVPLLIGLSPELHDNAIRALIALDGSTAAANPIIRTIIERSPFWPADVVPEKSSPRDRDRREGLIAAAVVHADRCGLLADLLSAAASARPDITPLREVTELMHSYDNVRRTASSRWQLGYS